MTTWNVFDTLFGGEKSQADPDAPDQQEKSREETFAVANHEIVFRKHFDGFMKKGLDIDVWKLKDIGRSTGKVPSLETSALWLGPDGGYHILPVTKFGGLTMTSYDEADVLTFFPSEVIAVQVGCTSSTFRFARNNSKLAAQRESHCFSLLLESGSTVDLCVHDTPNCDAHPGQVQRALVSGFSSLARENARIVMCRDKAMLKGYKHAPPIINLPEETTMSEVRLRSHPGAYFSSPRFAKVNNFSGKQVPKGVMVTNPAASPAVFHPELKEKPQNESYGPGFDLPFRGVKPTNIAHPEKLPAPVIVMDQTAYEEHLREFNLNHRVKEELQENIVRWNRAAREVEMRRFGNVEDEEEYAVTEQLAASPPPPPGSAAAALRALNDADLLSVDFAESTRNASTASVSSKPKLPDRALQVAPESPSGNEEMKSSEPALRLRGVVEEGGAVAQEAPKPKKKKKKVVKKATAAGDGAATTVPKKKKKKKKKLEESSVA